MRIDLPWPPSVNRYWRNWRGRIVISAEGRAFRESVRALHANADTFGPDVRLLVAVDVYPPDRRKRDIDNLMKATLDALEGCVFEDDNQVDHLVIIRREVRPGGALEVEIDPI
jgi:crossover junction endodeoxyribonuclease RusA